MICQVCGKKEAIIKITRIRGGTAEELHTCEECAGKVSPFQAKLAKKKQADKLSVENLLKDLLAQQEAGAVAPGTGTVVPVGDSPVCLSCGLDFARYKQTYMLGCPDCYDAFGERLVADIRRIHGADTHVGGRVSSAPDGAPSVDIQARVRALRHELEECVESENYTRAAQLRDEIRRLAEQLGAPGGN